ncbi:winged helix-turn-helix domain-containing protein [Kordiimonas aquimaris]|uniref:winged helix-turn-helix domain-containing protein n=1 Tax=Kordiimonas aquimaris TaxID=707591 RepID=UPI0021D1D6AE|nr:winged helix-turn-helix domain-containing protein [Kordiimonas aquimaris]
MFEPNTLVLKRDAQIMSLKHQSAAVLALLVENAGDVVTRDTIRETIWHDRTIEFDHGINACIRDIRRVLDDSSKNPRYIETLPKVGYRFIGTVDALDGQINVSRRSIAILLVALVAVIFSVFWFVSDTVPESVPLRLAVMPFHSSVEGKTQTPVLKEMSVRVASQISEKQSVVEVVSAAELFGDPERALGMGDVSRWLEVDYLIAGTISRDGNGNNILSLRLIRTDGYVHVWTRSHIMRKDDASKTLDTLITVLLADMPAAIENTKAAEP